MVEYMLCCLAPKANKNKLQKASCSRNHNHAPKILIEKGKEVIEDAEVQAKASGKPRAGYSGKS